MVHRVCDLRRGTLGGGWVHPIGNFQVLPFGKVSVWLAKTLGSVLRVHDLDPPHLWRKTDTNQDSSLVSCWFQLIESSRQSNGRTMTPQPASAQAPARLGILVRLSRDHRNLVKLLLGMMVFVEGEAKEPQNPHLTCEQGDKSLVLRPQSVVQCSLLDLGKHRLDI